MKNKRAFICVLKKVSNYYNCCFLFATINMIVTIEGQPWKTEIFLCRFVECLPREPFTFTPPFIKGRHVGILLYKTQLLNQAFYLDLALAHCIENVTTDIVDWMEKGLGLFDRETR